MSTIKEVPVPAQVVSTAPPVIEEHIGKAALTEPGKAALTEPTKAAPAAEEAAPDAPAGEETKAAPEVEETKEKKEDPRIASRFAALSKREKQILERERAMQDRQRQLEMQAQRYQQLEHIVQNAKANPIAVLEQLGLSYEQITDYILQDPEATKPVAEKKLEEIERKIKAYEEAQLHAQRQAEQAYIDNTVKNFKNQIVSTVQSNPEKFELVALNNAYDTVFDVVEQYFNSTGELLTVEAAAQMVEEYLTNEAEERILKAKKFQSKFSSKAEPSVEAKNADAKASASKTLTNTKVTSSTQPKEEKPKSNDDSLKRAAALLRWND